MDNLWTTRATRAGFPSVLDYAATLQRTGRPPGKAGQSDGEFGPVHALNRQGPEGLPHVAERAPVNDKSPDPSGSALLMIAALLLLLAFTAALAAGWWAGAQQEQEQQPEQSVANLQRSSTL